MYGYVRPDRGELKVSEYERFRGVYCGLCHELKTRYGPVCRFLVNYDFTFLAMLLSEENAVTERVRRCPYRPIRKTSCPEAGKSMASAADCTVILAYWKLKDGVADKSFFPALGCRLACLILRRHYKKAVRYVPDFAASVKENLDRLSSLEKQKCPSLDAAADTFAAILESASTCVENSTKQRVTGQLLYHLGRIIYVLDAVDDLEEDIEESRYNPLRHRYALEDGKLSREDEFSLRRSLQLSHDRISGAFALLDHNPYMSILSNILYYGLPAVTQSVFAGTWKKTEKANKERSSL